MITRQALSIVYHDVVEPGQSDASGFPGKLAGHYKLDRADFVRHLEAIHAAIGSKGVDTTDALHNHAVRLFLTFDDGGSSAYSPIADSLERFGWRGHFFVTTNYIGTRSFLSKEQIRELRRRGHVIGSHSATHPGTMSACDWDQLVEEWGVSTVVLADILGEPVTTAAVPGGFYSRKVARCAAAAGIRVLFNSEPTMVPHRVHNCAVMGRYVVLRGMPPSVSAALASGRQWERTRQSLAWSIKKPLKSLSGYAWLRRMWLNTVFREKE